MTLATTKAALASAPISNARPPGEAPALPPDPERVKTVIRARQRRERFFQARLFSDPAWDMLLDLFVAQLEQRRVTVSSLCIAAAVPSTTGLRWIHLMETAGFFQRERDERDRRRVYITLTPAAIDAMNGYFATLPENHLRDRMA